MSQFMDKKLLTAPTIDGEVGSFSSLSPVNFEKCRERFATLFTETTNGFYFMHHEGKGRDIAKFLDRIEAVLELKEPSKYAFTNRPHILWIEPSDFWRLCPMRRSLLTCLLRSGIVYEAHRDNFQEALFSHEYLKRTRKALMRFLFGFTNYTGVLIGPNYEGANLASKGWLSVFEFKDEPFIRQTLVSPNQTKTVSVIDLGEPLWL
jgi:hypothetical protein